MKNKKKENCYSIKYGNDGSDMAKIYGQVTSLDSLIEQEAGRLGFEVKRINQPLSQSPSLELTRGDDKYTLLVFSDSDDSSGVDIIGPEWDERSYHLRKGNSILFWAEMHADYRPGSDEAGEYFKNINVNANLFVEKDKTAALLYQKVIEHLDSLKAK
jgi:hypothetical protein